MSDVFQKHLQQKAAQTADAAAASSSASSASASSAASSSSAAPANGGPAPKFSHNLKRTEEDAGAGAGAGAVEAMAVGSDHTDGDDQLAGDQDEREDESMDESLLKLGVVEASRRGLRVVVARLIANVSTTADGASAPAVLKLVSQSDSMGNTAVHMAAKGGFVRLLALLLHSGAPPDESNFLVCV
jgi:Ankyrin repeat